MNKKYFYVVGFTVLMLFDTLAQLSIKLASNHVGELSFAASYLYRVLTLPWIYGALIGYLGAFITWMTLLKHAPIGPAFAASHLEMIPVLILSTLFFDERLTTLQIVGGVAILAGIFCLSRSEAKHNKLLN